MTVTRYTARAEVGLGPGEPVVEPHDEVSTSEDGRQSSDTLSDPHARVRGRRMQDALTGGNNPLSISSRLRRHRFEALLRAFPDLADMSVVDLGGRPSMWQQLPVRPRRVVCVNFEAHESPGDWLLTVQGDACDFPAIERLGPFDLAFSNSTIEHVGGHARRVEFANAIRSLASRYWVQTPNRYFPVEPHAVFPAFQFLPIRLRASVARRWPLSPLGNDGDLIDEILSIELLSATDLRFYFPEARIWRERVAGLTKSLSAYHDATTR